MKMRSLSIRRWGVAALTATTLLGALSILGEGVASAATPTVVLTAGTVPPSTLGTGTVNGADITVTITGTVVLGDTVDLVVACDHAVFAGATGTTNWVSGGPTSNGACGAGVNNEIVFTSTTAAVNSFTVTAITYTATGASSGNITDTATYVNSSGSSTSNSVIDAVIANATVTAATPVSVVKAGTGDAAIGNISIGSPSDGTIPAGYYVCVTLTSPAGLTFDTITGLPTVAQTNGASNATVGAVATEPTAGSIQSAGLSFEATTQSTGNPPTYTLSNLHVDVPGGTVNGAVTATVVYDSTASCTTPTTLGTGTAFIIGSQASGAIYGITAIQTTAAEFNAQFVSTSGSTATCTNNGNAVLATAADPFDALSAAYLESQLSTGVLITDPTSLDPTMLATLQYAGVQRVYVVGGLLAIDQADLTQLAATPAYNCGGLSKTGQNLVVYSGSQLSGATADDTAVAIDNYISANLAGNLPATVGAAYATASTYNQTSGNASSTAPVGTQKSAILVSDTDYLDSASAGGIAYQFHVPVILTPGTSLGSQAAGELSKLGITQVLVLGGQLAITPSVVTSVQAMSVGGTPIAVIRVAGIDGTQTAADLALFEGHLLGWANSNVLVAQGAYWSDALDAAALSGLRSDALLLTESPTTTAGPYTDAVLKTAGTPPSGLGSGVTTGIQILGGPLAIPQSQITEMQQALAAG